MNYKFMHKIQKPQRYTKEHLKGKKKKSWIPTYTTKKQKILQPPWLKLAGEHWESWVVSFLDSSGF